jgi:TonB family protein
VRRLCLQLILILPSIASAQAPTIRVSAAPLAPIRVTAPLLDLVVFPDTLYGVSLWASPGLGSKEGHRETKIDRLFFLPETITAWLPAAQRLADSAAWLPVTTNGGILGVRLEADRGMSSFLLGYVTRAAYGQRFFFRIETGEGAPWQAPVPDSTVHAVIRALIIANGPSRIVPLDSSKQRAFMPGEEDELPRMTKRPSLHYPAHSPEGRVWIQYVVDSTGTVDLASVQVVLSDGPAFEQEVRRALKDMRFEPGRHAGHPVRVLVFQTFVFKQED